MNIIIGGRIVPSDIGHKANGKYNNEYIDELTYLKMAQTLGAGQSNVPYMILFSL